MTDYQPFIQRLSEVIEELNRDYDLDDARREGNDIGLDADECLVMGLENRVELGRWHAQRAKEVIEKLSAEVTQLREQGKTAALILADERWPALEQMGRKETTISNDLILELGDALEPFLAPGKAAAEYSREQQRVADYLLSIIPEIGAGDDPIGFLIASHASLRDSGKH